MVEEIDGAASVQIIGGMAFVEFTVAGIPRRHAMRISHFRESIRAANRAMDAWAEKNPGEVVSLSGRKRRK